MQVVQKGNVKRVPFAEISFTERVVGFLESFSCESPVGACGGREFLRYRTHEQGKKTKKKKRKRKMQYFTAALLWLRSERGPLGFVLVLRGRRDLHWCRLRVALHGTLTRHLRLRLHTHAKSKQRSKSKERGERREKFSRKQTFDGA